MKIVSKKIRASARGEACTFRIPGVCNHNPETTVLCHLPDESRGMGIKADDISAAYGCSACHDVVDGRAKTGWTKADMEFFMRRAQTRTLRRLVEKGLIEVAA